MFDNLNHPIIWFLLGSASIIVILVMWKWVLFIIENRLINLDDEKPDVIETQSLTEIEKDEKAKDIIKGCQKRLWLQKKVNPDWVEPLKVELPLLVEEIAKVYYPQHEHPILAPGIGEFSRAIEMAACDIASFLQETIPGRMINVSAHTVVKGREKIKRIFESKYFKETRKWYKRTRPLIQIIKYKSPYMWAAIMFKNSVMRGSQVTIVGVVGRRSIDLYSGKMKREKADNFEY